MRTEKQVAGQINDLRDAMKAGVENISNLKKDAVKGIIGKGAKASEEVVESIIISVTTIVKGAFADGYGVPDFTVKYGYATDESDEIDYTVKNRSPKATKFKETATIKTSETMVEDIANLVIDTMIKRFVFEAAKENVIALNEKIAEVCAENELTLIPSFDVDVDNTARVLSATNNGVVFNVTLDEAMEICKLRFMNEGTDEYSEYVRSQAVEAFVESLKSVQTIPALIKSGNPLIKEVVGNIASRADIMLRKAYHRQAKYIGKSGIGYIEETVKVKKEDISIFAIVEKSADGEWSVVLNPFDIKTLAYVDVDVIKLVKKQSK